VMTRDVVTVAPDATLGEAAALLLARRIGCLPIVKPDGTLVGLVTETDLLRAAFLPDEGVIDVETVESE
jgi:CBS domain-containing protein